MANYSIQIAFNDVTLTALKQNGWQLRAFKGVKGPQGGIPTLWFSINEFSSTASISWEDEYGAYVDNKQLNSGVQVDISSNQPIDAGDVMTLNDDGRTSISTNGGMANAFTIYNAKQEEWLCGITQSANGNPPSSICAFNLYGSSMDIMEPYEKVVLLFATSQMDTGTVVEEAESASVEIVLSLDNPSVQLAFDINKSWDTKGNPNVSFNPLPIDLASKLIIPGPGLSRRVA